MNIRGIGMGITQERVKLTLKFKYNPRTALFINIETVEIILN